ncbi:cannabinoid receptor 2-like [Acropora millepora]|uniref:cannabinoid receptor 2-like n=1 Tax=Acropora millepora TaxID=45264 RepID=UPI001CF1F637|nr:cannabinoid receptor 2-like [Acropora millepora]
MAPNVVYQVVGIDPLKDATPLRPFYHIFITFNGLLNPLVYYGRNEDVRTAVRSLIRCPRCCGEVRHGGSADNGQRPRDLLPSRRNNRVTAGSHQSTHQDSELGTSNNDQSKHGTVRLSLHPIPFEGADEPEKRKRRKKFLKLTSQPIRKGVSPFNQTASSRHLQNQRCLIAGIPEHVQHTIRDVTNLVVLPLDTLLALLSVTCNSVIFLAVQRRRSIQRPSMLFLCSLSISDTIWAIMAAINNTKFFIFKNSHFCPKELIEIEIFAVSLCFYSTLGSLAVISYDRLLAVSSPWRYRSHSTRSLAIKQIILVWVIAAIFSVPLAIAWQNDSALLFSIVAYIQAALSFSYALTIIVCYIGVLIANCRHGASMHLYGGPMRTVMAREKKVANTVGLILLVLLFCFVPAVMAPTVVHETFGIDPREAAPFYFIFVTLNGLLNPLVYYGRNKDVRTAVRSLIRCPRCCGEVRRGGSADNGQRRRDLFHSRRNNRVTVESHQSTH